MCHVSLVLCFMCVIHRTCVLDGTCRDRRSTRREASRVLWLVCSQSVMRYVSGVYCFMCGIRR